MHFTDFDTLSHILFPVKSHLKGELLKHILAASKKGQVIVCTRTRLKAKSLTGQLARSGFNAVSLEGHPAAVAPVKYFEEGTAEILVVHEAACLEVPIRPVTHIIYYDMPYTAAAYFRLPEHLLPVLNSGTIFSLVSAENSGAVTSLEMAMEQDLERRTVSDFNYDVPARQTAGTNSGTPLARRSGVRQPPVPSERPVRGFLKHRASQSTSGRGGAEGARKVVGSRSETSGGNRQVRSRPENRSGRNTGSSREWMEKESRHSGSKTGRKTSGGESRTGSRRGKPSSLAEGAPRKTVRRSIFGITAPIEIELDDE